MDENHYNFIKRPLKIVQTRRNDCRLILDKIQNFEKPNVRSSTFEIDCVMKSKKHKQVQPFSVQESLQYFKRKDFQKKSADNYKMKNIQSKKLQLSKHSLDHQLLTNCTQLHCEVIDTSLQQHQQIQSIYCSTDMDKEQVAVDNLCNLSLNEGTRQQTEHFLSCWANSYPLKQSSRKISKLYMPVDRSTSFYSHRSRPSKHSQVSQLESIADEQHEHSHSHKLELFCELPTNIKRMTSYNCEQQTSSDLRSRFVGSVNEEKVIFFRNGIINQLRRKQQMGRHAVFEEWRQINGLQHILTSAIQPV